MTENDPHTLQRFLTAQDENFDAALKELRDGRKQSHWIWYVFPQVSGLGSSSMAQRFAIQSRAEAVAYLEHPILGPRLRKCCDALLAHRDAQIDQIMGFPDNLKLQSSMTLFAAIPPNDPLFQSILDEFYGGRKDPRTMEFLSTSPE